jgi:CRP-like cAMP-binding protein
MHGGEKPAIRSIEAGDDLMTQGEADTTVYLILDGMFVVDVDGREVAEIGPGAVVGERAALAGGVRTATLRATTRARVAAADPGLLEALALDGLAAMHRREEAAV